MTEEPKGEVEIIPPGEEDDGPRIWIGSGTTRIKVIKLGPFGSLAAAVTGIAILMLAFALFSGLALILIPVALLLGAGAYVSGLLGGSSKRLR